MTTTERWLTSIWSRILQHDAFLPDSAFFDVGGDSISALSILVEIERHCHIELTLEDIYTHNTLRAMARCIDTRARSPQESPP